jgi:hypothetical protein
VDGPEFQHERASGMKILALDLGKFNSVACLYNKVSAEHEFQKIRTTPCEVRA